MGSVNTERKVIPNIASKSNVGFIPNVAQRAKSRLTGRSGMEPVAGLEPATYSLQNCCSTAELHRQVYL